MYLHGWLLCPFRSHPPRLPHPAASLCYRPCPRVDPTGMEKSRSLFKAPGRGLRKGGHTDELWGQPCYVRIVQEPKAGPLTRAWRALRASCQGQECKNGTASAGGNPGPGAAEIGVSCLQGPRSRRPQGCCPSAHGPSGRPLPTPPPRGPTSTRPRPRPASSRPRLRGQSQSPASAQLRPAPPPQSPTHTRPRPFQAPPPASPPRPHTCPGSPPQSPAPMLPPATPPLAPPTL